MRTSRKVFGGPEAVLDSRFRRNDEEVEAAMGGSITGQAKRESGISPFVILRGAARSCRSRRRRNEFLEVFPVFPPEGRLNFPIPITDT
jgi:hypothetical protein